MGNSSWMDRRTVIITRLSRFRASSNYDPQVIRWKVGGVIRHWITGPKLGHYCVSQATWSHLFAEGLYSLVPADHMTGQQTAAHDQHNASTQRIYSDKPVHTYNGHCINCGKKFLLKFWIKRPIQRLMEMHFAVCTSVNIRPLKFSQ